MKRVIVCGGRDFTDYQQIEDRLRHLRDEYGPFFVIEGGQTGADRLARRAARELSLPVATVDADWASFGGKAGPVRNKWMLTLEPDRVEAWPTENSKGTWNMVRLARTHGLPTVIHGVTERTEAVAA